MNYRKLIIPSNFMFIFDAGEFKLLSILIDQDFKTNIQVKKKYYSKSFLHKLFMGGRRSFEKALNTLIKNNLVICSTPQNGLKHSYRINNDELNKLISVLDLTNNAVVLQEFFTDFWKNNKKLDDITRADEEFLHSTNKEFNFDNINYKAPENNNKNNHVINDIQPSYFCTPSTYCAIKIGEIMSNFENKRREELDIESKMMGYKSDANHVHSDMVTLKNAKNHVHSDIHVIQVNNNKTSGCNPPNRGESFQDKIIDIPDIIYFDKNKKEESGSSNKIIEEDMEKDEGIFNLFDELSDDNKENYSFLEKKKQKNTLGAKAPKNYDNPLDILEIHKDNNVIPSNILKELNSDEHIEEFKNILFYFSKKYINGSCVKLDEAEKYYQELRDDYFSSDELLETSIKDVFKNFIYIDDEVYTFYNKVDCSSIKVANKEFYNHTEIPNNINFPDNLKNNEKEEFVINEFIKQFEGIGVIELKSANSFIAGLMKGLNMMYFQKYLINQPRLAPMIIKELEHRGEDESDNYWELPNNTKNGKSELLDVVGSEISKVEEKIKVNNNISSSSYNYKLSVNELKENNIFIDIFNDFRITRRMNVFDVPDMATRMLKFALIEESDTITLEEKEKLLYAISNKLGLEHTDNRITDLYGSVIKNKIK